MDVSDRFVAEAPSPQNVLDIFADEWSSRMPPHLVAVSTPGHADLFADGRIVWANAVLGPFRDKDILELGPLEGAHSTMLEQLGAASVTAIEGNARAFLKCLCVKELMGLTKTRFKLGNFVPYLQECHSYDAIICSGVLYHMTDPLQLLDLVTRKSDRLLIWTHYYDAEWIAKRDDREQFADPTPLADTLYRGSKRLYPEAALTWKGFSGGADSHAIWMEKPSILEFFAARGFETNIEFDHPHHPNGPSLAICAKRG